MAAGNKKTEKKQRDGKHCLSGRGPGRPKGSVNKFTLLKESFLAAFERTGGVEGLVMWINLNQHNRSQFYTLITKLFPTEVDVGGEVKHGGKLTIEIIHIKP